MMKGGSMKVPQMLAACAFAFIVLCVFPGSFAFAAKPMVVAVNANWPPMQMKDSRGNIVGYEIDLLKTMAAEAGFKVRIVNVPWNKLFKDLNTGRYDAVMASVSITDSRKEKFDFSEPYFTAEQLLVVPRAQAGSPIQGKDIAVFKLTTGADAIRKTLGCRMTYYTVEQSGQAFRDLARGDLAGVYCDSPVALSYASSKGRYTDKFAIASGICGTGSQSPREEYGVVVKKGDAGTLALINKGLQAVKAKGIEGQLKDRWMKE